jgi:hypothetical protein
VVVGCGSTQAEHAARPSASAVEIPSAPSPAEPPSSASTSASSPIDERRPITVSLVGDEPVALPGTELTAHISDAFHKTRAPLVGVSVLFEHASGQKAQVSWRIESNEIDRGWRELQGQRYDDATSTYVEERIAGFRVRLESIDDSSAGGSPTAITLSLKREP